MSLTRPEGIDEMVKDIRKGAKSMGMRMAMPQVRLSLYATLCLG